MPRWPVEIPRATPHGLYGYERRNKKEGSCASRGYPCVHYGLDLAGPAGTQVFAPEDGSIHAVFTGSLPPYRGYGPEGLIFRGKKTGAYHLLAHLDRGSVPSAMVPGGFWDRMTTPLYKSDDQRRQIEEGQLIGTMSDANHTHWEVRDGAFGARTNPAVWVKRYVQPSLVLSDWTAAGAPSKGGAGVAVLVLAAIILWENR